MEWDLLDLAGPIDAYAIHTPSECLVYSSGTIIVIWDVNTDKKVNIRCHEATVSAIFFDPRQEYLITIESSMQPTL